jgi:hypothetical protein
MKNPLTFNQWLDTILAEINELPIAWNFNLYEPACIELVGTQSFSKKDEDWACDEIFASRDKYPNFELPQKQWEISLKDSVLLIENYLENGNYKSKLLESYAVGCGFADGNLTLIYVNPNKKFRQKKQKITLEMINQLPLWKLYPWIVVYAGYREIEKSSFGKKFDRFKCNELIPTEEELTQMREFLFNTMVKNNVKL